MFVLCKWSRLSLPSAALATTLILPPLFPPCPTGLLSEFGDLGNRSLHFLWDDIGREIIGFEMEIDIFFSFFLLVLDWQWNRLIDQIQTETDESVGERKLVLAVFKQGSRRFWKENGMGTGGECASSFWTPLEGFFFRGIKFGPGTQNIPNDIVSVTVRAFVSKSQGIFGCK